MRRLYGILKHKTHLRFTSLIIWLVCNRLMILILYTKVTVILSFRVLVPQCNIWINRFSIPFWICSRKHLSKTTGQSDWFFWNQGIQWRISLRCELPYFCFKERILHQSQKICYWKFWQRPTQSQFSLIRSCQTRQRGVDWKTARSNLRHWKELYSFYSCRQCKNFP